VIGEGMEMMGDVVRDEFGDVQVLGLYSHNVLQTEYGCKSP
jgi:hypothetical protein